MFSYGYRLAFRLTGYGWHQRSEFNASFTTYRFFSGMQVLHALARFETFFNRPAAPYEPGKRRAEIAARALPALGVPGGAAWASPAVPLTAQAQWPRTDRQTYNTRQELAVTWPQDAVFPTWGTLQVLRPSNEEDEQLEALLLSEHPWELTPGDVFWIGKKRALIQLVRCDAYRVERAAGEFDTGAFLEVPAQHIETFTSYSLFDVTARGYVVAKGRFRGTGYRLGCYAVPEVLTYP